MHAALRKSTLSCSVHELADPLVVVLMYLVVIMRAAVPDYASTGRCDIQQFHACTHLQDVPPPHLYVIFTIAEVQHYHLLVLTKYGSPQATLLQSSSAMA